MIPQGDVLIKMMEKGIALGFSKDNTTADEIYSILLEVLTNPSYKQNVLKLSQLMRDVSETPLEKVVNFVGYLIRHRGAEHLKLSSRHLNAVQYFCIDTISFLTAVACVILFCVYQLVKFIWKSYVRAKLQSLSVAVSKSESYRRLLSSTSTSNNAPVSFNDNNNYLKTTADIERTTDTGDSSSRKADKKLL